jgi:hypothetical protein
LKTPASIWLLIAEPVAATSPVVFSTELIPQYPVALTPATNARLAMVKPKSFVLMVNCIMPVLFQSSLSEFTPEFAAEVRRCGYILSL